MILKESFYKTKRPGKSLCFWLLIFLVSCAFTACDSPPKDVPNVVIIVMDTARQDRLDCYGYNRNTSPVLTELVKNSSTYTRAYTPGGWTPPAHASLFTGLFSIAHQTTQEAWKMGDSLTTLAEVFKTEGYETIGIIENPMLNKRNNFDQGFSRYYECWRFAEKGENRAFTLLKKSLNKRKARKPFFMFINLIEPHSPYDSSKQFKNQFISNQSVTLEKNMWPEFFLGKKTFTDDEIRHLNELYDAELLYVDYVIGKMMRELQSRNLWQDTVFIVTSDHGENIGDHEMMDHVFSLHESIIKIPLIIHYPKLFPSGTSHEYPVQLTDIFPTLLEIIGADAKRYPSQGRSLLGREAGDNGIVFSEYYFPKQALQGMDRKGLSKYKGKVSPVDQYKRIIRTVIKDNMKLIWGSDGKHELYNLRLDPGERVNLAANKDYVQTFQELIGMVNTLTKEYDLKIQKAAPAQNEELDKETLEKIKSLGYVQ